MFKNYILLTILILFGNIKANEAAGTICKSATIRSVHDFNQLQNCTLVTGFVRIVEMDMTFKDLQEIKPSKIEEINEYLLVYRVNGLDSLERLFPLLAFIRGVELLYDNYALAIMENRDMENIGLVSLLRVLRGSVRIEANPLLCYIDTIDWIEILGYDKKKSHIHITNNKSPNHCPLCGVIDSKTETRYLHASCWSHDKFQLSLNSVRGGVCVHSKCLTGCNEIHCKNCINYLSDEGCTNYCQPHKYKTAFKRQCVTNCTKYGLMNLGLHCVEKCPKHYYTLNQGGVVSCVLNCTGNFVVHDVTDLEDFADCTTINGSLTIEIHDMEKPIVEHLEMAFRNLNEITGYLKILNSPQLTTLHFFKNLHTIRGLELIENRYTLYVVNNNYLEELFIGNVAIFNGCVYFHLNPLLCVNKITDLEKNFKDCKMITITDVSEYSNGERAVCGEDVFVSNATVADFNSTAALIEVDILDSNELLLLLGYTYFYKEAPFQNVTRFDGRHGCGNDGWFTNTVLTKRRRHIIRNLKPATQYAYFVNSLTIMDLPYLAEHISPIRYFKTSPARPSAVAKLYAISRSNSQLDVHWWPPLLPNGLIEKYVFRYYPIDTSESKETLAPNTPDTEVCDCPMHHKESQFSTPYIQEYYNTEQTVFKTAVQNFIFHRRRQTNDTKSKQNATDPDYETILNARYRLLMQKIEEEAVKKQEEGKESYVIEHPKPICEYLNPNERNEIENDCEPLEFFTTTREVPGSQHHISLFNLQPGKTYRFSIRACVKGLANGCGPEKVILAATISEQLASILAHINQK